MTKEEAIDAIKAKMDYYESDKRLRAALETLIPELRESEDERIRKELVEKISNLACGCFISQEQKQRFIHYLEKQKESLHIQETCKENSDSFIDSVIEVRSFQRGLAEGRRQEQEKQKEQKPVMIQWTGKNLKEVIDFTGKSPKFGEWFKSWEDFENYVHSHGDILKLFCEDGSHYEVPVGAWIVKTPDGYNIPSRFRFIQKPAEWSKNDTVFLNEITDYFENKTVRLQHDIDMYAHWLKSLPERFNLQPKQEWSEEDETIIEGACNALEIHGHTKLAERLKSLRPSWKPSEVCYGAKGDPDPAGVWKPSEEQMDALLWCTAHLGGADHRVLAELYEQLKKLM